MEDTLNAEFGSLSLNAILGTAKGEVMKLRAIVKNKVLLILVDSGSSHCFISSAFVRSTGLPTLQTDTKTVRVANGDILIFDEYVPHMDWWIQGHSFSTNMRVLDLQAYDAIIGYDWLKVHSPITHDWGNKSMFFYYKGKSIKLCGVQPPQLHLEELPVDRLGKWWAGNDIWAMAIVDVSSDTATSDTVPAEIQQVLDEYEDVFHTPQGLPPEREYDHSIPVFPNAIPISSRPYRYSPLHKDEIERQVRELLHAGLITPSTSPYASPVLLVQKKDGSWRFCVDYRKLNDITIKNIFPITIIERNPRSAGSHQILFQAGYESRLSSFENKERR
jgi:hypothetical protein